ncbi:putative transcription factor C2H2 family [Helianthus anomalus]
MLTPSRNRFGNQGLIYQNQNNLGNQKHLSLNQNKFGNQKLICQNETFKMIQGFIKGMFQQDKFWWCSRCQQNVNKSRGAAWHRRRIHVVDFRECWFVNNNK